MAAAAYWAQQQLIAIKGLLDPQRFTAMRMDMMQRVVFTVEAAVKQETPVLTGHLRRSIAGDVETVNRGVVGTNVIYAAIVNRRNPYLERGRDNAEPKILALLDAFADDFLGG